ncbi:MAG: hypothetical protein MUO52_16190, partial [Desulfobacterales bacterium]|nr:hypothetical protein [Desulfobacterales bacterium]
MERAWLPEKLLPYPRARKALGLIVPSHQKDPANGGSYLALYREKVVELVRKDRSWRQALDLALPYLPLVYCSGVGFVWVSR